MVLFKVCDELACFYFVGLIFLKGDVLRFPSCGIYINSQLFKFCHSVFLGNIGV